MKNILRTWYEELTAPRFLDFVRERDAFYNDLAEAIMDDDGMLEFLESKLEFATKHGQKRNSLAYRRMIARLEEKEGQLSHILEGIVPADELMSLHGIDQTVDKAQRVASLRYLASLVQLDKTITWSFRKALITPAMVLPILGIFGLVIALAFVPQYEKMLSHEHWPLIGRMLYWLSMAVVNFWPAIIVVLVASTYGFFWSFPNWTGKARSFCDNYIPYRLYRDRQSAKFMGSITSLMNSDIQLVNAMEQMRERANPWMNWHINQILINIDLHPDDYGQVFDTGIFSPNLHERLSNYARRAKNSEGEEDGLSRMGVEGVQHVLREVEKASLRVAVLAAVFTVAVMIFLEGGNMMIGNAVRKETQKAADQQLLDLQR